MTISSGRTQFNVEAHADYTLEQFMEENASIQNVDIEDAWARIQEKLGKAVITKETKEDGKPVRAIKKSIAKSDKQSDTGSGDAGTGEGPADTGLNN